MIAANVNEVALESAMVELLKAVVSKTIKTFEFRTLLKRLEKTLRNIEPIFYRNERLRKVLDRLENETKMFIFCVADGTQVVLECSQIKCWNVYKKFLHANKLIRLNNMLFRFFQIELQDNISPNRNLFEIYALGDKLDQVLTTVTKQAGGFSDSCSAPGLPYVIIGLDFHLQEVKRMLLKDDSQVLTER